MIWHVVCGNRRSYARLYAIGNADDDGNPGGWTRGRGCNLFLQRPRKPQHPAQNDRHDAALRQNGAIQIHAACRQLMGGRWEFR